MENVKVFISVPMIGKTEEEIEGAILLAKRAFLKKMHDIGHHSRVWNFVDNYHTKHTDEPKDCIDNSLHYLSEAIDKLSTCQIAVFGKGWEGARGCVTEHRICELYKINIVEPKKECKDGSYICYY